MGRVVIWCVGAALCLWAASNPHIGILGWFASAVLLGIILFQDSIITCCYSKVGEDVCDAIEKKEED